MEIKHRQLLSKQILEKLQKELDAYNEAKTNPSKRFDHSIGEGPYKDQEHLQSLIRETRHQIRTEEKTCWNDVQQLEWEQRQLQRELAEITFSINLLKQSKHDPK